MVGKTLEALRLLDLYIQQQRKHRIVIYTNDKKMKGLIGETHPNVTVQYLEIPKPSKTQQQSRGVLITDDFAAPTPLIFKPYYRFYDSREG